MHMIICACVLTSELGHEHSICIFDSAEGFAHATIISTVQCRLHSLHVQVGVSTLPWKLTALFYQSVPIITIITTFQIVWCLFLVSCSV